MKKRISAIGAVGMLIVLILDSKAAVKAGREGVELCLQVLVPSLFPFFVLSDWILHSGGEGCGGKRIEQFLGLPEGTGRLLPSIFLGGFPTGARSIHRAWVCGMLSRKEAEYMLAWGNQVGPAFLFGVLGQFFDTPGEIWFLWFTQIGSAAILMLLFHCRDREKADCRIRNPKEKFSIDHAIKGVCTVCGWVIICRIGLDFVGRWLLWWVSPEIQIGISGLMELTNGCLSAGVVLPEGMKMAFFILFISFGGVAVGLQTVSVVSGLSVWYYWLGKVLQTVMALAIWGCSVLWGRQFVYALIPGILALAFAAKNRSGNFEKIRV